jgi:hypothetical protein
MYQNHAGILSHPGSLNVYTGNTKGGSITVPLTFCLSGLELAVCQLAIFVFTCKID